jgi:hypothetical protein
MERIARTAGTAGGWVVVLGVVALLAPEAGRQARELATEAVASVRARFRRAPAPPAPAEGLDPEVRELTPAAATR